MSSKLQLDVRNLSLGRRHLVNTYKVKAGNWCNCSWPMTLTFDLLTFKLVRNVARVMGYPHANFCDTTTILFRFMGQHGSDWLRDGRTDGRTKAALIAPFPYGRGHNNGLPTIAVTLCDPCLSALSVRYYKKCATVYKYTYLYLLMKFAGGHHCY